MSPAFIDERAQCMAVDPYLALPLDGIRLIEASAGTGKTFTLATLFTRLVVEQGLRIGQILAVTFTDAATQELRKRIRERLALHDGPKGQLEVSVDRPRVHLHHPRFLHPRAARARAGKRPHVRSTGAAGQRP